MQIPGMVPFIHSLLILFEKDKTARFWRLATGDWQTNFPAGGIVQ
jgi:hypothetical protein